MLKRILLAALLPALLALTACESRQGRAASASVESSGEVQAVEETQAPPTQPEATEAETEPVDTEGARRAAEEFLAALQTGAPEEIREHADYRNLLLLDDNAAEDSLLAILKKLRYEIVDVSAEESSATVTARLSNINMETILADYVRKCMELEYNNALSAQPASQEQLEEQTQQMFYDLLDESESNRTETVVVLKLEKTGGNWRVQVSEALRDAATGGYYTARQRTGGNAGGGQA